MLSSISNLTAVQVLAINILTSSLLCGENIHGSSGLDDQINKLEETAQGVNKQTKKNVMGCLLKSIMAHHKQIKVALFLVFKFL